MRNEMNDSSNSGHNDIDMTRLGPHPSNSSNSSPVGSTTSGKSSASINSETGMSNDLYGANLSASGCSSGSVAGSSCGVGNKTDIGEENSQVIINDTMLHLEPRGSDGSRQTTASTISGGIGIGIGIGIVPGAEELSTGIQAGTQMNQNHDSIVANASLGNLSQLSNTSTSIPTPVLTVLIPFPEKKIKDGVQSTRNAEMHEFVSQPMQAGVTEMIPAGNSGMRMQGSGSGTSGVQLQSQQGDQQRNQMQQTHYANQQPLSPDDANAQQQRQQPMANNSNGQYMHQNESGNSGMQMQIQGSGAGTSGAQLQSQQVDQQRNQMQQTYYANQQSLSPNNANAQQQHQQQQNMANNANNEFTESENGRNTLESEIRHIHTFEGIISPRAKDEIVEKSPGGRYLRFSEKLGSGAYKDVYRAYDTSEGIEVAWNVVNMSGVAKMERQYIVNEVRLLEKLNHSNIISFHGSWVNRELEQVIFVTEILSSGTLKQFINKVQIIRYKIAKRWAIQILKGLQYLHSQDPPIIHRDLKCDNIFINGTSGDLRIGDLGLSTVISKKSKALSVLGTPEFMAPELYDESYDEKVDIYAFGMCMLEIFTKEIPYRECSNPAQIYKRVISGIEPQSLGRIRSVKATDFIRQCLGMTDEDGTLIRPSALELLSHSFLQKREDDSNQIEVDPPLLRDLRTIQEVPMARSGGALLTVNTEATRPTNSDSDRTAGSKLSIPSPADKGSNANNVARQQSSESNNENGNSAMNTSEHHSQNFQKSQPQHHQSFGFDGMPDTESNMKPIQVLMGRGQAVDASNGHDHLPIPIQREESPPVSINPSPPPLPSPPHHPFANYQQPIPAQIFTNNNGNRIQMVDATNERQQHVQSVASPGAPASAALRYLRMAVILDDDKAFPNDIMQLRLTVAVGTDSQTVQFGFHLVQDDAVQVAREMVTELNLPNDAILEISETISAMARQARMQQGQYKATGMLQQQQGIPPRTPHSSNTVPQTMSNQFIAPTIPQMNQFNATNYDNASIEGSIMSLPNELQVSALPMGESVPPVAPPYLSAQYQAPHLSMPASSSSSPDRQTQVPPIQSGVSISSQETNGIQNTHHALLNQSHISAISMHDSYPPQMNTEYQTQPLSMSAPNTTSPIQQLQIPSFQLPPAKSKSLSGVIDSSQRTSRAQMTPNDGVSEPQHLNLDPPTMLDITMELQEGDSGDEDGIVNSEEMKQLKEELEKKKSRAQKAFHTRMENLQRSREEKEAQHLKSLEKHEKERAELEKRLQMAEAEQHKRLQLLDLEFVQQVAEQSKKLFEQNLSIERVEPVQQDEENTASILETRLSQSSLVSVTEKNGGETGSNRDLMNKDPSPTISEEGFGGQ